MKRTLSFAFALIVGAAMSAAAQHPAAAAAADSMTGTWAGPFTTDHGPTGTMSVTVAHDSSGVNATMTISAHMDVPPSTLANLKHDGNKITWTQETAGMSCTGSASHGAEGALVGTMECGHATLSFTLTKTNPAKATSTKGR